MRYHLGWDNLNVLSNAIGEVGINYLYNFKEITNTDLKNSNGLYFLNTSSNSFNLQKLVNLKLLNYYKEDFKWPKYLFTQTLGVPSQELSSIKSGYNPFNCINLPSNNLFESTGTFLNTEGTIKNAVKFISNKKQTKEDWQIIRKVFSSSNNINFLTLTKSNEKIFFNCIKFKLFKKFVTYLNLANSSLSNKNFNFHNNIKKIDVNISQKYKKPQNKLSLTKIKIWLNDFYIGGLDSYSQHSNTMIECSKLLRSEKNNFSHLS
jgi:hypothetical protein